VGSAPGGGPTITPNNSAFNGQSTLHFAGNQYLGGFNITGMNGSSYTIFTVEAVATANQAYVLGSNASSTNNGLHTGYNNSNTYYLGQFGNDLSAPAPAYNGTTEVANEWTVGLNTATGHFIDSNGSVLATNTNTTGLTISDPSNYGIVGAGWSASSPFLGDVGEILIYNSALTPAQQAGVESYLISKWENPVMLPAATPVILTNGGTLNINNLSHTIGSLNSSDSTTKVLLGTAVLTTGNDNTTTTFAGAISGAGGLSKIGSGTFALTGNNTYGGSTTVGGGVLSFRGNDAVPSGSAISLGSGTLQISNDGAGSNGTINVGNSINQYISTTTSNINVGNNGSANTGNTVAFGALSVGNAATGFGSTINFTALNGYHQSYTGLNLPGGTSNYTTTLNPTSTTLSIGGVTNQKTTSSGNDTLTLSGTTVGNQITGAISDGAGYNGSTGYTGVTKAGSSRWILTGSNTYSGPTSITGGTLVIGGGGVLGAGGSYGANISISSNALLEMNSTGNQYFGGVLSGAGGYYQIGSGTVTFANTASYTGPTFIGLGQTLVLGTAGAITNSSTISLANGATINGLAASSGFVQPSAKTLTGTGNTSFLAPVTINGTLLPGGLASSGTLNVSSLTFNPGSTLRFHLGGAADLITSGGNLNLSGGSLYLYSSGGTTTFATPGTYPLVSYAGAFTGLPTNMAVINQSQNYAYTLNPAGGTLALNVITPAGWTGGSSPALNWSNSGNWTSGLVPSSGSAVLFSGSTGLSNSNDIAGLALSGVNFVSGAGAFNISGNSIQLGGSIINYSAATQTIGMNMGLINGNQTVSTTGGNIALNGVISDGGLGYNIVKTGTSTLFLGGANTFSGPIAVSAGTIDLTNSLALQNSTLTTGGVVFDSSVGSHAFSIGALSGNGNISLTDNGNNPVALTVGANTANMVFNGTLSGLGSLTKVGNGSLAINSANTFSGSTLVAGGTIVIGNSYALQNSTFDTSSAGVLSFGSQTFVELGGLVNGGGLLLANTNGQSVALYVGNNNSNTSYSGNISGGGSLTKVGSGTLYLSGTNTYADVTTINSGNLQFQGNSSLPTNDINLNGGSLQILNDGSGSGGMIALGNNVILNNQGTVAIDVGNNGSPNTGNTVAFGTLDTEAPLVKVNFTAANGYLLNFANMNLSPYGGDTTILNPTTASVTIGIVTPQAGATLDLDGTSTGNVINGAISDLDSSDVTSLIKSNSSVWTLNGANSYSGPTTISGGTLIINAGLGSGSYANTIANSGALVLNVSSPQMFGGVISGPGAFIQTGNGATTFNAANTYTGPTRILAGSLVLGPSASIAASSVISLSDGTTLDVSALGTGFHLTSGQTLTGSGNYTVNGAMTANAGSFILPGGAVSAGTLNIGNLTLGLGSGLKYVLGGNQDVINVGNSGGLSVGGAAGIGLYQADGASSFGTPGTYTLMNYIGSVGGFTSDLYVLNPSPSVTYTFAAAGGSLNVTIAAPNEWNGGGNPTFVWSNSANWSSGQAPTNGHPIAFGGTLGLSSTNDMLGLNVSAMLFKPSASAFNLTGGGIQLSGAVTNSSTATQTISMNVGLIGGNQNIAAVAGNLVVNGVISDGGNAYGLNTTGSSGSVVLGAANTYSGATNVLSGSLSLAHPQALQNSTVNMAGGALTFAAGITVQSLAGLTGTGNISLATAASQSVSLNIGGNGMSSTYNGVLSGLGGLVKQGAGTFTVTGSHNYSGATIVSGGILQLQSAGSSGPAAAIGIKFVGGGSPITGSDGVYPMSNWTNLAGTNFNGSALTDSNGAATTATLNASAGGTFSTGNSDQLLNGYLYGGGTFSATINGIPYRKYNAYVYLVDYSANNDVVTIGGTSYYYQSLRTNPFTQITNTTAGTYPGGNWVLATGLTGNSQTITTSSMGDYGIAGIEIVNVPGGNVLPAATPVTIMNGSTLDMTNQAQTVGSLSSTDGMGSQVLLGGGALTIGGPGASTFDGVISDAGQGGSLVVNGGGLTLAGQNTYGGLTTVAGGTLSLASTGGQAIATNLVVSGGVAQLLRDNQLSTAATVSVSGGLFNIGSSNQTVAGVQITGGTIGGTSGVLTTSGSAFDARNGYITGILGGTTPLNKTTTGTVVLGGANTYSGSTSVTSGNLMLANPLAVQNSTVSLTSNGTLAFAQGIVSPTFGALTGANKIALTTTSSEAVTLNVGNNGQNTTYTGALTGPGGLIKVGGGILTLTNSQGYAGPTNITGGTLQLASNAAGAGNAVIGIHFTGGPPSTSFNNGVPVTGAAGPPGAVMSNWNNLVGGGNGVVGSYTNYPLVNYLGNATTVTISASSSNGVWASGTHDNPVLDGYLYSFNNTPINATISGIPYSKYSIYVFSVDSDPTPSGGREEEITVGSHNYYYTPETGDFPTYVQVNNNDPSQAPSGNYVVQSNLTGSSQTITVLGTAFPAGNEGVASLASIEIVNTSGTGSSVLPVASPVSICDGATLDMTNGFQSIASLSSTDGLGSQVLVGSGVLTITGPALTNFDGNISGVNGTLIVKGGGLTLTGSNTYTGGTSIAGGTLQLGNGIAGQDGTIAGTSGVLNNSALIYDLAGSQTVSYAISGSGSVTKGGTGTLTLSNPSSGYSGATNINSGLLVVAPGSSALPQGPLGLSGGSLDVEGNSLTVNTLNGFGTIGNGASGAGNEALLVVANGGTYSGTIRDGGFGGNAPIELALVGGSLILSGSNTFSGGTIVLDSELIATNVHALADGSSLTVGDPGQFPAPIVPSSPVAAATVPEPTTLLLLATELAAAMLAGTRCRR
jgi:autotransporter-associated beta strand protein